MWTPILTCAWISRYSSGVSGVAFFEQTIVDPDLADVVQQPHQVEVATVVGREPEFLGEPDGDPRDPLGVARGVRVLRVDRRGQRPDHAEEEFLQLAIEPTVGPLRPDQRGDRPDQLDLGRGEPAVVDGVDGDDPADRRLRVGRDGDGPPDPGQGIGAGLVVQQDRIGRVGRNERPEVALGEAGDRRRRRPSARPPGSGTQATAATFERRARATGGPGPGTARAGRTPGGDGSGGRSGGGPLLRRGTGPPPRRPGGRLPPGARRPPTGPTPGAPARGRTGPQPAVSSGEPAKPTRATSRRRRGGGPASKASTARPRVRAARARRARARAGPTPGPPSGSRRRRGSRRGLRRSELRQTRVAGSSRPTGAENSRASRRAAASSVEYPRGRERGEVGRRVRDDHGREPPRSRAADESWTPMHRLRFSKP